jgi:hypothetical protein
MLQLSDNTAYQPNESVQPFRYKFLGGLRDSMQSRQVSTARVLDLHFDAVFLRAQCALGLQQLTHCTWKSQVPAHNM